MKKYILEEKEVINKKAFFVPISPIYYKVKVSSTDFFTKRTVRKKVSWQTYENKKHMFKSMMISGTFLLFLLIIGVFSVVSSTIPKTNEFELTKAWIYFTKLDVEKTRAIQKTSKKIRING